MNRPPAKLGLDIFRQTCYTILRKCGHRTSASISAFQAEEVGSIPIARSMQKKALSSPELGAFFAYLGQNAWRSSLVYKKIVDIVHTTYYIKGKGA